MVSLSFRTRNFLLALAGLGSFALVWPARLALRQDKLDLFLCLAGAQVLLALGGAALIWQAGRARSTLFIVLGVGALLRLPLLFETPALSDDIYRYVWDGRVQAAGINPYRYLPISKHLAHLRDREIFPQINRRNYARTIYPPAAQMIFLAVHQITTSVTGFKSCLMIFEAITFWSLIRLLGECGFPRARVLVYAWNPLVLWEFSSSGHIDAALIALILLALVARRARREILAGVFLGAAALTKFFPLVLLPALSRRWNWKLPVAAAVTCVLGYLPYLGAGRHVLGFLSTYTVEEGMQTGRYFLLLLVRLFLGGWDIPSSIYLAFVLLALATLAARAFFRGNDRPSGFLGSAAVLAFAFTFFLSPRFPWYWTWTIPFLAFLPWRLLPPFFLFTSAALIFYADWFSHWPFGIEPHLAMGLVQLLPSALFVIAIALLRSRRSQQSFSRAQRTR